MTNKSRFSTPRTRAFQLLFLFGSVLTLMACGTAVQSTPDVDALVDARLTEVAAQRDTDANQGPAGASTPEPPTDEATSTSTTLTPTITATVDAAPDTNACSVLANALNVRAGPGEIFAPVAVLQQGTEFIPERINPEGTFIEGQAANGVAGWISTRADLITCPQGLDDLIVDAGPPTPTSTPTTVFTPTPTPTPTQAVAVVIPRAGGGDGDLTGDVFTLPELFTGTNEHPIFRERILFQLSVNYPENEESDTSDGAGIDFVEIFVTNDATGDTVYETRLDNPPYCALGGSSPCPARALDADAYWPGTNNAFETGDYSINFNVVPISEDADGGNWRIEFSIWLPGDPPPPFADLAANFTQIQRGADELVFQVEAWDPRVGDTDGAGIADVRHRVIGPGGDVVYEKVETDPAYCAFGGDAPCPVYSLSAAGNRWPNGAPAENGVHRLIAIVRAADGGRTRTFEETIEIYLEPAEENATPTVTPTVAPESSADLHAEVVQLGNTRGLIFQVVAWDPQVDASDGAGIENVEMALIGPDGDVIHERTEGGAPYCLFSNAPNSSTCNIWAFNENNFRWPNGAQIEGGEYRLRARLNAQSGATRRVEIRVQISQN